MEYGKKAASGISILEGPIGKNLIKFAAPIAASSILQQLFNSADTAVVGHFTNTTALAAVGTNAELVGFLVTMSSGTAVGLNVLLSWKIGEKRSPEQIRRTMHTGFLLAFLIGILLMAAAFFFAAPVLHLMHAPKAAYSQAVLYLRIYSLGLPLLLIYDFVCAAERARGNSLRPLRALIFSGILNVLLNLAFVIVFRLGVAGVAIATDLSTGASVFLTLRWLSRDQDPGFRFRFSELCLDKEIVKTVLRIGVPAALQGAVFCIANLFVQSRVNLFGVTATSGAVAAINFEYIVYYIVTAFGQGVTTFVGQNQAAGNHERCRRIFRISLVFAFFFCAALSTSVMLLRWQMAEIFSKDPAVMRVTAVRLCYITFPTPIVSFLEIPAGFLRGYGYSALPAIESILGICVFRVIWVLFIFPLSPALRTLYLVYPCSWILAGTMVIISLYYVIRKHPKQFGRLPAGKV